VVKLAVAIYPRSVSASPGFEYVVPPKTLQTCPVSNMPNSSRPMQSNIFFAIMHHTLTIGLIGYFFSPVNNNNNNNNNDCTLLLLVTYLRKRALLPTKMVHQTPKYLNLAVVTTTFLRHAAALNHVISSA
jgi:hypothetical protein